MSLIQEIKEINAGKSELRKFGLTLGVFFLALAAYIVFKRHINTGLFIVGFSSVFIVSAIVKPPLLINAYKIWMALALTLNWITTRVILGLLFYTGFVFIKLLGLVFGKRFLELKIEKERESYWIKRDKKDFEKDRMEKQF
jgi:hypothetical protein